MKTPFLKTALSAIALLFFITSYAGGDPPACTGANHRDRNFSESARRNRSDYYSQRSPKKSKGKYHSASKHYHHH